MHARSRRAHQGRKRCKRVIEPSSKRAIHRNLAHVVREGPLERKRRIAVILHNRMLFQGNALRNMTQRIEIAQGEIGRYANRAKRGKAAVDRNHFIEMFGRKMVGIKGRGTDERA